MHFLYVHLHNYRHLSSYGGADSGGTGNGTAAKLHPKARSVPTSVRGCLDRQALHAKTLGFTHPMTGARMQFESPMAHDMAAALSTLRQLESR
jgi:23S rRNA-/tRNA-specific pseudouridylate synthase